ncbi:MAG: MFS transporter, partial [Bacteroidota bacterium]
PWILKNLFGQDNIAAKGIIADNVKYSFYIGAFFFLSAVLYTVFTTKEYPPSEPVDKTKKSGSVMAEVVLALRTMPARMKIIALVQFFTWPGLFLMWFYYSLSVAYHVFGATSDTDPAFGNGKDFAGLTLAFYSVITFLFSFVLPSIADKLGRKLTHSICLTAGAVGLFSIAFISNKYLLYVSMTGVGIAWASILSMPYAMLSGVLPKNKVGIYMGIFNFFIVLPEIIAAFCYPWLMKHVFNQNMLAAVQSGGVLMLVAALICYFFIKEQKKINEIEVTKLEIEEQRPI